MFSDEVFLHYFVSVLAEDFAEHVRTDIWACVPVGTEVESVGLHFFECVGQRGVEVPHESLYGVFRYLPDAEKAEYVVDAVGVEVFCHFAEACFPPGVVVFFHNGPVVGGESPVLPHDRECVGRGSGL